MGRRSMFSATAFKRMVSSYNAKIREEDRIRQIKAQEGCQKELPPTYDICQFDFNEATRVAHIDFIEFKKYRKIEKYVTQNYVRYPVYGNWNTKTKHIKKTIKLTNEALEGLIYNSDELISTFAAEIMERINNQDLAPSWFLRILVNMARNEDKELIESKRKHSLDEINKIRNLNDSNYAEFMEKKEKNSDRVSYCEKKKKKLEIKLAKCQKKGEGFIFECIISFGILALLKSQKREEKIKNNIDKLSKEIDSLTKENAEIEEKEIKYKEDCEMLAKKTDEVEEKAREEYEKIRDKYDIELMNIEPLPTKIEKTQTTDFIPLKKFIGMKYEKIIGCYIIHNIEFDKYYVGQSKDVMKRITRDHFSGTEVRNIIFAEDYFKSSFQNKADIFEVKVIRLETKDELDRTEKQLIEEYDSFNSGYNGTSGNK